MGLAGGVGNTRCAGEAEKSWSRSCCLWDTSWSCPVGGLCPEQGRWARDSRATATAWVSEAAPGLSNGIFLIHSLSEAPHSQPDPSKGWQLWKSCQLLKAWKSPSANSPKMGILGACGAECRTQSCQESMWATTTCQKWVSFLYGFPLIAPAFDDQEGWVERVSVGFLSGTLLPGAQHFSGIAPLSREGGDWV